MSNLKPYTAVTEFSTGPPDDGPPENGSVRDRWFYYAQACEGGSK